MASTLVCYSERCQLLNKYCGTTISNNAFHSQHTLVCRLVYELDLNYTLLQSSEGNSDVRRLRSVSIALIDTLNRIVDEKRERVFQFGTCVASSRTLSTSFKELAASVSSLNAQDVDNTAKITELNASIRLLEDKVKSLES